MKKDKVCIAMSSAEKRLFIQGMLFFRSKVLAEGIDTVDINRLLEKGNQIDKSAIGRNIPAGCVFSYDV